MNMMLQEVFPKNFWKVYDMTLINNLSELPSTEHFALIVFKTKNIYHEGDERSRIYPGHGYPAHTETINTVEYHVFETEKDLLQYLRDYQSSLRSFRVIKAMPCKITTSISVEEC